MRGGFLQGSTLICMMLRVWEGESFLRGSVRARKHFGSLKHSTLVGAKSIILLTSEGERKGNPVGRFFLFSPF